MKTDDRRRLRDARKEVEAAASLLCDAIVDGEFTLAEDAFHGYLRGPIEVLIRLHDELLKKGSGE